VQELAMGLLKAGKPLLWKDSKEHNQYIRRHGVQQFLNTLDRTADLSGDHLYYGDEVEYALCKRDPAGRAVKLSLRADEVLAKLREREQNNTSERGCTWHQEYGSWMVEATPSAPYGGYTSSLLEVEQNMRLRRSRLLSVLEPDELAPTMTVFPLMGCGDFVLPPAPPGGPASQSATVPDACINVHPRFPTLTANIRSRRGSKVDIRVPTYKDEATTEEHATGDCMAFGMGCCCLQVTFQAADVNESRYLYDQMAVIAPIMMALTAATPIFAGRLAATDARWNIITASVDHRTPSERGGQVERKQDPAMVAGGTRLLSKSRYDSISCYISDYTEDVDNMYNDIPCEVDEEVQSQLVEEGVAMPLARHVAHLFARDPLVAFEGAVAEVDDEASTEHFESINSTNWQSMRWKPPPPPSDSGVHIGWRTEFRPMEVQLTDFENAAFTAFTVLLSRVLLVFNLDVLIPLSKVDENMKRAHQMGAVSSQKFWFRKNVLPHADCAGCEPVDSPTDDDSEEVTMDEIMNGKGDHFPGLIQLCYAYLEHIACDATSFARIHQYLSLISKRARGELLTPASWMRDFVLQHPEYNKDSIITPGIAVDLMTACDEIGRGVRPCKELHGDVVIEPIIKEGLYLTPLSSKPSAAAPCSLLKKLRSRACIEDGFFSSPSGSTASQSPRDSFSEQVGPDAFPDDEIDVSAVAPL
jgi:glutamate--cysteine ligase catalytic subunit